MKYLKRIFCLLLCVTLLAGCVQVGEVNIQIGGEEAASEDKDTSRNEDEDALGEENKGNALGGGLLGSGGQNLTSGEPVVQPDYEANFVAVKGADPGLTIRVVAPAGYSTANVLAGMTLKNLSHPILTDPSQTDLVDPDYLVVEGSGGIFTVTCAGGFNEGEAYQIQLTDGNLCFEGQDGAVRYYNISTAAQEVNNMKLDHDVQFLSADALNGAEASQALSLDGLFRYDVATGALAASGGSGSGSFVYDEGAYHVGDIVAVYEGVRPDQRTFADAESEVAYTRITEVTPQGDGRAVYQYVGAEQEDVLFVPDVIPVHQECLLSAGADSSVTLGSSALQFSSDDIFKEMRLDENTEVEPGDYLAFYTGSPEDGTVTAYAEVTEVVHTENEDGEDSVDIQYKVVTMEEMMSCIDVYRYTGLSEAQIRASYNEAEVKQNVINELTNNGYLLQSSYSLAEIAMDTEEAQELFGDTPMDQLTFYYGQNEEYSMSGKEYLMAANGVMANGIEVKGDPPDVDVSPNIVHFAGKTGYGMGVRAEAHAKFHITIRGTDNLKAALKVDITFFFEVEFVFGYTIDATSVWKWKWIFPYVADYTISGSASCGIYLGAGITASATLFKNQQELTEEELALGIPWPEGVEQTPGAQKVMAMSNYLKDLSKKHDTIFPPQTTGGGDLSQKYAKFIKGADRSFIDILNPDIFDWNGCIDPFHILAFRLRAQFIVSAQFNAAIGVSANLERSYRHTFNFLLFERTSQGTQTEETDNAMFRADAYIFGAVGLRVGLRLTVAVGLFDARLDSIGIEAEAGLYARFWGYFYAGISIMDIGRSNEKTDMYYSGGLLAEVGAYYVVTFFAQLGDGAIAYRKILLSDEYPFFGVGVTSIVSDFAYKNGDKERDFSALFTKDIDAVEIPENVFTMVAMSIKDGSMKNESRAGQNALDVYDITFDDPNFEYAYRNGKHLIVRKDNKRGGEGTLHMTLTWKGKCFEQLSTQLSRTIEIEWEANQVVLSFLDREGNVYFETVEAKGTPLTEINFPQEEPEEEGYIFLGWLLPDGTRLETLPDEMPEEDIVYISEWYRLFVDVIVEYYMPYDHDDMGNAKYYLSDTDTISEVFYPGDPVENAAEVLEEKHLLRTKEDHIIEGKDWFKYYRINEQDSVLSTNAVAKDGSTTFKICLEWDAFTITFDYGDGRSSTKQVLPDYPIEFPQVTRQGYVFDHWVDADGNIVDSTVYCTGDAKYTAVWAMIPPTMKVELQVKVKSWGMQYYWNTILAQDLVFDSYTVTVQDILNRVGTPAGYVYSPDASGRNLSDVITISDDGTTKVILRFNEDKGGSTPAPDDSGSGGDSTAPDDGGSGGDNPPAEDSGAPADSGSGDSGTPDEGNSGEGVPAEENTPGEDELPVDDGSGEDNTAG